MRSAVIDDGLLGQVFTIGSDRQRLAFLKSIQSNLEVFLSLVWRSFAGSAEAVGVALDLVLRRKALAAEALAAQRDALLGGKYPALAEPLRQWTVLRQQIARKTLAGPAPKGPTPTGSNWPSGTRRRSVWRAPWPRKCPR